MTTTSSAVSGFPPPSDRPAADAPLEVYDALCTLQVILQNALDDVPHDAPEWETLDAMDCVLNGLERMLKPILAILPVAKVAADDD